MGAVTASIDCQLDRNWNHLGRQDVGHVCERVTLTEVVKPILNSGSIISWAVGGVSQIEINK